MTIGKKTGRQIEAPVTPPPAEPEETKSRKQRVKELLSKMEGSLVQRAQKATMGDLIRLIQLERELEVDEQPRKVVVSWKESPEIQDIEA